MGASRAARHEVEMCRCHGLTRRHTQCKRNVRGSTLCYQHVGGPIASVPAAAEPHRSVWARAEEAAEAFGQAAALAREKALLGAYRELAADGWRATLADKLSSHLGESVWQRVDRGWDTEDCRRLAEAARTLEELSGKAGRLQSDLGRPGVKQVIAASSVATAMVNRANVVRQQTDAVVLSMRVAGMALCEMRRRLLDCQCLKDLADKTLPGVLEADLDQACVTYLDQV